MSRVHFLSFRGHALPIKLGYWVIKKYTEETGNDKVSLMTANKDFDPVVIESLIYWGLVYGHQVTGRKRMKGLNKRILWGLIPIPYTFDRKLIPRIFDECMAEFMHALTHSFVPESDKKKASGRVRALG